MYERDIEEISKFLLKAKDYREIKEFFHSFFTRSELENISKRWKIFKYLRKGKRIWEIAEITEYSSTTISRINQSLKVQREFLNKLFKRYFKK